MISLHPALIFFLGVLVVAIPFPRLRAIALVAVPILGAVNLYFLPEMGSVVISFLGYELTPFRSDRLSFLFAYAFHIAAFLAILYAFHINDRVQQLAGLIYAGSALGAVFAGDLITLFVFWELLALSSVFLVWARRTERAYIVGMRYLFIQLVSGLLLLVGALLYYQSNGTFNFDYIGLEGWHGALILVGIGIKCAFPLFHNWLTETYAEATPTGTVFLSAFTTKTAIYLLARGYPGTELLVYIGVVMTCFPIFFAVIENDLRRVLAYSMINQLGFMVCGIGIGTALAINGAVAHAFNDIIFKGLLFMSMGAVLVMTGRINGSDLGGLYKTMPKTTVLCIIGAVSISAFPLFSGFVSKSMIMAAAINEGYDFVWLAMLFASAGVFHHAGIKIPYFAFFAHDSGLRVSDPAPGMLLAMFIAATLCLVIGSFPTLLYAALPFTVDYTAYDTTHVLAQLQILFFSALAFVWLNLNNYYPPELRSTNLDVDWIYRRFLPNVFKRVTESSSSIMESATVNIRSGARYCVKYYQPMKLEAEGAGKMVLASVIVLIIILGLSLF